MLVEVPAHSQPALIAAVTSGLRSSVSPMKPRRAAHRLLVPSVVSTLAAVPLICAMLRPHRALSSFSTRCFRFKAPGLLFMLLFWRIACCLMIFASGF